MVMPEYYSHRPYKPSILVSAGAGHIHRITLSFQWFFFFFLGNSQSKTFDYCRPFIKSIRGWCWFISVISQLVHFCSSNKSYYESSEQDSLVDIASNARMFWFVRWLTRICSQHRGKRWGIIPNNRGLITWNSLDGRTYFLDSVMIFSRFKQQIAENELPVSRSTSQTHPTASQFDISGTSSICIFSQSQIKLILVPSPLHCLSFVFRLNPPENDVWIIQAIWSILSNVHSVSSARTEQYTRRPRPTRPGPHGIFLTNGIFSTPNYMLPIADWKEGKLHACEMLCARCFVQSWRAFNAHIPVGPPSIYSVQSNTQSVN